MADATSPELYPVPRSGRGTLALMAAPRPGEALEDDVVALAAAGVTDVVCLLPDEELGRLGLAAEPDLLARKGLRVHRLPVPDFGVPADDDAATLAEVVTERLADGAHVVVHCRGGIGRSSTVAATVLVREGLRPQEAWAVLAKARRRKVPETGAQERLVARVGGYAEPPQSIATRVGEALGLRLAAAVAGVARRRRARRAGGA
ncbi:MAG: dual specificity protein phosphatase family protein [Actinobacteria bacterium]|nr:dual specificity protein phosphatase family protein [Actinomycetota bacterium]